MLFATAAAVLDWFGVIVFAISGALVASRKQMDIVGFALLGTVTGIGGGTLRDILLGELPVFWVRDPAYLITCVLISGVVFFTAHIPESRYRLLLWFDALGLALFAVTGAERALLSGSGPVVVVAMGVITVVLSREVYVTAALVGATVFAVLCIVGAPREIAIVLALGAGFALRAAAIQWGWSLPRYKDRPGRRPDDINRAD